MCCMLALNSSLSLFWNCSKCLKRMSVKTWSYLATPDGTLTPIWQPCWALVCAVGRAASRAQRAAAAAANYPKPVLHLHIPRGPPGKQPIPARAHGPAFTPDARASIIIRPPPCANRAALTPSNIPQHWVSAEPPPCTSPHAPLPLPMRACEKPAGCPGASRPSLSTSPRERRRSSAGETRTAVRTSTRGIRGDAGTCSAHFTHCTLLLGACVFAVWRLLCVLET